MIIQLNIGHQADVVCFQFYSATGLISNATYAGEGDQTLNQWPRFFGITTPVTGIYVCDVTLPEQAIGVLWTYDDDSKTKAEDLTPRFTAIPFNAGIRKIAARLNLSLVETPGPLFVAPAPPDLAGACLLYGYEFLNLVPVAGGKLSFRLLSSPRAYGEALLENSEATVETNDQGYWELQLIQGATYAVTCAAAGLNRKRIVLPEAGTANLKDLI